MFNKQTPHVFDCTRTASSELLNLKNQAQIRALCTALQQFVLEQLDMDKSEYKIGRSFLATFKQFSNISMIPIVMAEILHFIQK